MTSLLSRGLQKLTVVLIMLLVPVAWAKQGSPGNGMRSWQHEIMMDALELYQPLAKSKNFRLHLNVLSQNFVTASADNLGGGDLRVNIGVGLLESPRLTPDIFRLVLCHEIGHLLGGDPKLPLPAEWDGARSDDGGSLLSSEGQSDFYSSATCFRRLARTGYGQVALSHSTEFHNAARTPAPPRVRSLCAEAWGKSEEDRTLCERVALAGVGFLTLVADFNISLEVREKSEAVKTIVDTYPTRQCRLDTILAGALCRADLPLDFSESVDLDLRCQDEASRRPKCWYKR